MRISTVTIAIVCLHMALWFMVGVYTFHTVSLDSVEMIAWSRSLDFGYYKHPPMPAFILAVLTPFFDTNIAVFLASQIMVGLSAFGIWVLARRMTTPQNSMLAVVLFLLIPYYNLDMLYFNHNPVQLPFWIWTIVTCDWTLRKSSVQRWFIFGVVAGVALYTKYTIGILYMTIGLYVLIYRRDCLNLYTIGGFILGFGATVMPHILWLFNNDFIPLHYASGQTAHVASFGNVIYFISAQIGVVLFVLLGLGCGYRFGIKNDTQHNAFLSFMVFVPVMLIAIFALVGELWLKTNWGFPRTSHCPKNHYNLARWHKYAPALCIG
jgi:4-amino-4-deoxy-L-arabinose transferase-like glycosyltransferase